MRARTIRTLSSIFALTLLLASCDQFFETNLFRQSGLGQVDAESLETMDAEEILLASGILTSRPSDSFFDAFAGASADTQSAVIEKLREHYKFPDDDPLWNAFAASRNLPPDAMLGRSVPEQTPAELEAGRLVLAGFYLNDRILDPVSSLTVDLTGILNDIYGLALGLDLEELDIADLEEAILKIPAGIRSDPAVFARVIDDLATLDAIYDEIAWNLLYDAGAGMYSFHNEMDDAGKGSIFQFAAAATIVSMISPLAGLYSDGAGHEITLPAGGAADRATALFAIANNTAYLVDRPENLAMLFPDTDIFVDGVKKEVSIDGMLGRIVSAAGIDLSRFSL